MKVTRRKLFIALSAAMLGSLLGLVSAHAAARLFIETPGACVQDDGQFQTADGGCKDLATGLIWSASSGAQTGNANRNYNEGITYCDTLVEGGYDDWRSPSLEELKGVALAGGASHLRIVIATFAIWSKTTQGIRAWAVVPESEVYGTAYSFLSLKMSDFDVLCVRPTVAPPPKGRK